MAAGHGPSNEFAGRKARKSRVSSEKLPLPGLRVAKGKQRPMKSCLGGWKRGSRSISWRQGSMVIKGNFTRRAPKPQLVIPKSINKHIGDIAALKRKPHQQEAINLLYEIANDVAPLMEHYGLKVGHLQEMSPKSAALLGLNVNHGAKILLRLRPHGRDDEFLPLDDLIGTMLHELVHNSRGPHDQVFYKKLDEYFDKRDELKRSGVGVRGEGFRLGGDHVNDVRKARLKKLDKQYQGGVFRLGGAGDPTVKDKPLRELVREAAIRRTEDNKWCNGGEKGDIPDDDELEIITREDYTSAVSKRSRSVTVDLSDDEEGSVKKTSIKENGEQDGNSKTPVEVIDLTSD